MICGQTAAVHTLGCKANQYDTGCLLAGLDARGYALRDISEPAAVYIINTCTVTRTGDRKSLQMIRRVKKQNPSAKVAVCGCLAKLDAEAVRDAGADMVFDAREPDNFFRWLDGLPACTPVGYKLPYTPKRTRAYIKVQDGCDSFCAFCVVPYARGPVKSRPLREVLEEAGALVSQGVREIVLTGIQAAAYGKDLNDSNGGFSELIKRTAALTGLARLRLGSIEPYAVDDGFIEAIRHPVVCRHFHLSLQSGCSATLNRMNRRYTAGEYASIVRRIRAAKPGCALTTDIIAGFPGETDAEFEESLLFTRDIGFSQMHVFEYSPRPLTAAAGFPGQVSAAVKKERSKALRRAADEMRHTFLTAHLGKAMEVLFESERGGLWEGYTGNYITVRAKHKNAANKIFNVRLVSVNKGNINGEIEA